MPPKNLPRVNTAPRLPPLPKLRVRRPDKEVANSCTGVMAAVLGCWASSGQAAEGCRALEEQLRKCMDNKDTTPAKRNYINFHLGRLYPRLRGPAKKK